MPSDYYKQCPELDECCALIDKYYLKEKYEECFQGHLKLAEKGYPLAECQVGYFYMEGLGVEKDLEKSFYWTMRGAEHGDRDAQYNLASCFYENGVVVKKDMEKAKCWYVKAAQQKHNGALEKCKEFGILL